MSIACTVHIGASPTLRAALASLAALHAALALGIATGWAGEFHCTAFLLPVHACATIACSVCAVQRPPVRRLDVSGLGAVTVTVQQWLQQTSGPRTVPVQLLPGSTFLPGLLVLRLQDEQGNRSVIAVLPDAIRGGEFRRVAAALRTIAARDAVLKDRTFELIAGGQARRQ